MPKTSTRVAAYALLVRENRILLCRLSAQSNNPGLWTVPGGGIDFGEHPAEAAVREVREETGYEVRLTGLLEVDSIVVGNVQGIRVIYRAEIIGGELREELDGSTDTAVWLTQEEALALPLVDLAQLVVKLAFGGDVIP